MINCFALKSGPMTIFFQQDSKRISSICTIHKRRPPGPTVMFFAGGYLRRSLDVLECFDPLSLTWTTLSPLSLPKSGLGAAYIGKANILEEGLPCGPTSYTFI